MTVDLKMYIEQIRNEEDIFTKARLLHSLVYEKNVRIVDVAKKMNKQPSYICHFLRLVKLPPMVIDGYYSSLVTLSHLFIISRIKDKDQLMKAYEELLKKSLTIQQTEILVREILHNTKTEGEYLLKEEIESATEIVKKRFPGVETQVVQTRLRGKIIFVIKGNCKESSRLLKLLLDKLIK